jgi:methyl-accepting chemotaxis protein
LRRRLLAAALLPIAHGAILLSAVPDALKIAAALAFDLAFLAGLALSSSARRKGEAEAPILAEPEPAAAGPAETSAGDAASAEIAGLAGRLGEIRLLAEECASATEAAFGGMGAAEAAESSVAELGSAMEAARQGAGLLNENTSKIFEIANNLANSAEQAFNLSHEVESRAQKMAGELADSLAETEALILESKRISDILTIMSDISSTISLLSFNASIVAANAGSAGRPFSVVAKEMRKLAESTETSLKDITAIIREIQERIEKVAGKIRLVDEEVKAEKESLVAVAGDLQGVVLANEVVRTVSGLCAEKSIEEIESLRSMEGKIESVRDALAALQPSRAAADFSGGLRKIADLADMRD